jgi:hypothetical protein
MARWALAGGWHAALISAEAQEAAMNGIARPPNKQFERTVKRCRGRGAGASQHYWLAGRGNTQRAAAQLRRYAA